MQKYRKTVLAALLISETSHIFCCVLPTVFSIVSVLSGIGIVSTLPTGWINLHDFLHHWEVPMIIVSGLILALGWGLHYYAEHMGPQEQHKHCCDGHCGPSTPKKNKIHLVLKLATVLFLVNVTVYFIFHREHPLITDIPVHAVHEHEDVNVQ